MRSEQRGTWLTGARLMGCLVVAMVMVAMHLGTAAPAGARAPDLFRATNYTGETVRGELAVMRSRALRADLTILRRAADGLIDRVQFNLFADASFEGIVAGVERRGHDNFTLHGSLAGDEHSRFIVVREQGAIVMNIFSRFGDYQARSINGALVAVQQLDSARYPACGCGPAQEVQAQGGGVLSGGGDDGSTIDVMVFWTPQARNAAGGLANIQAIVQGSIAISNTAYGNSAINPRLRLVYASEINYTQDADMGTDLGRLRDTGDGFMDEVHALRDQYGADMVSLLVSNGQYCGIGYLMTSLSNDFASSAFTVSNYSCAVGNITFPHELGHNMGCAHDRDNASNALFSYSYGWRWFGQSGSQFRSVMAYAPGSRVPHFSNPEVLYDGVPTGVPVGQQNEAHNAQSINLAAFTIANWRQTAAPLLFEYPEGRPATLDPAGGTMLTVQINELNGGDLDETSPRLHVDLGGGGFADIVMTALGNGRYEASFPAAPCNTIVPYYVSARTSGGEVVTDPRPAPSQSFEAYVASGSTIDFADNFEQDLGWTVVNSPTLTDGAWNRGTPIGGGDRGDPANDYDGSGQCYLTDNVDGNSDVDGGSTSLISPRLDASGPGDPFIAYARWYSNHTGSAPGQDIFTVDISNNDGQTWTPLEVVGPSGVGTQGGWFHRQLRIADFVTPTDQMRVRFTASDAEPGSIVEAGVDAVEIIRYTCAGATELVDFNVFLGTLLAGGLNELRDSDSATMNVRSAIGFTALEPDLIDLRIGAETTVASPVTLDFAVESRINQPGGQATLRVRNVATNQFQTIDSWPLGMTEVRRETLGVDATNRVRASDGRIEVSVKYVVPAVFSAFGFDAFTDQVEISAN